MVQVDAELDQLEDGALMVLYANGDQGAARVLTGRLLPRVLSHATRVLGDRAEAEDVAQEAMLRLWRAAADWRSDGAARPGTWLYRVTANLIVDRLRRSGRAVGLDTVAEPADDAESAEAGLMRQGRMAALDAALARLPERQRQAVVLRHIEGVSNPEIAAVLDISVEAVESLTARGKRALAVALAGQKEALGYGDG
ncbi:RNA polymerase sigma factor [Rhodophyticola sp. CCM32]|uniref:RNA polymerase sigma factor n=1 Tax=Rhodophyticola sp. CCM32 TaxID=2916397 RepID=UPI00107FB6F7|nr:RNA polymerase sigma factor [Rhodophyticola sp. CCM32]QBY02528.1 RNA polymerase sigma factor [Rhodophyticola sp. CCM32]